ncbi:MAG TPA: class I SAM-dependent methyltransferase [Trueperaceae bacterium]|nr:class I SAM-dependent methyltransferase [Trueperaceae bacterium]
MERNEVLPEHVKENRRQWDANAHEWVAAGERSWRQAEPTWGVWGVAESELSLLPSDMKGMKAVELGCGTAYVSAWMARRGADVTGIDNSANQLATARRLAAEHSVRLELLHGNAKDTPFADAAFDFAISEYGAAIWCDPYRWIPEAHRILKPGGELVFLGNHPLVGVCSPLDGSPVSTLLVRPYFGLHRLDWREVEVDPGGIEFNLPLSKWFALFREVGFAVEDYLEPRPAARGDSTPFAVPQAWAHDYPSEQVWKLRRL